MGLTTVHYKKPIQPYKQFTTQAEADPKRDNVYNILDDGKKKTIATIDFKPARYNVGGNTIDASCTLKLLNNDLYSFCEDGFPQGGTVVSKWLRLMEPNHKWVLVSGSLKVSRDNTTDVTFAHRTVSNLKEFEYCNTNEVLAVRDAKEALEVMLQNNSNPSTVDLIDWAETHANAINNRGSTISLCSDDLSSEWLYNLFCKSDVGKHSTERKTNRSNSGGQFTVGTNKKKMIDGKSTNVNNATNLPPSKFDEKSMNIIASLRNESYERQDRLSKLMPDDVPAPAPETSGDQFLQDMKEKRDAHSQGTTATLPSTEPRDLRGRCMLAQIELAKKDSRFQINKKKEGESKTLKNDSGDESEYDDDESTNKSKPSKSKSTNKKTEGKTNTRSKRQSAPSSFNVDSSDESEYDDDESTNKSKPSKSKSTNKKTEGKTNTRSKRADKPSDTKKSWPPMVNEQLDPNKKTRMSDAKQKSSTITPKSTTSEYSQPTKKMSNQQAKRKEVLADTSSDESEDEQQKRMQKKIKPANYKSQPVKSTSTSRKKQPKKLKLDDVDLPKKKSKEKEMPHKKASAAKHEKKKKKKKKKKNKLDGYEDDGFVVS